MPPDCRPLLLRPAPRLHRRRRRGRRRRQRMRISCALHHPRSSRAAAASHLYHHHPSLLLLLLLLLQGMPWWHVSLSFLRHRHPPLPCVSPLLLRRLLRPRRKLRERVDFHHNHRRRRRRRRRADREPRSGGSRPRRRPLQLCLTSQRTRLSTRLLPRCRAASSRGHRRPT